MNHTYPQHKASFISLDANIVAVLIYAFPFLVSFVFPSVGAFIWILAIGVYFLEKDSKFIKFHAIQSISILVIVNLISLLFFLIVLILPFTLVILSPLLSLISYASIGLIIYCGYKAYHWITYPIPFIGSYVSKLVKED